MAVTVLPPRTLATAQPQVVTWDIICAVVRASLIPGQHHTIEDIDDDLVEHICVEFHIDLYLQWTTAPSVRDYIQYCCDHRYICEVSIVMQYVFDHVSPMTFAYVRGMAQVCCERLNQMDLWNTLDSTILSIDNLPYCTGRV